MKKEYTVTCERIAHVRGSTGLKHEAGFSNCKPYVPGENNDGSGVTLSLFNDEAYGGFEAGKQYKVTIEEIPQ